MNNFFISLILSAVISVVALFTHSKEPHFNQSTYTLKIFAISFITIFGGLTLLLKQTDSSIPEIEIGEADF
jgi:hypothetical protein